MGDAAEEPKPKRQLLTDWRSTYDFRLLTANDVYRPERLAVMRTLVKHYRNDEKTKVILAGDLLGASMYATAHHGESVIDLLNHVGVDYCVLGNHEFDFGAERLRTLMDLSRFPWLGSNVRNSNDQSLFANTMDTDEFTIETALAGEVKVGVFGLCTCNTPTLSTPGSSVIFEDHIEHAKRCMEKLKSLGCELIIALTHLSIQQDKELVEKVPGIHVLLGGHDHDPYLLYHRNCLIIKCGQDIDHLGIIDLNVSKDMDSGGLIHIEHSFNLISTFNIQPDPQLINIMEKWNKVSIHNLDDDHDVLGEVLFTPSNEMRDDGTDKEDHQGVRSKNVPLSTKTNSLRSHENSFGCLVADAIKWAFETIFQNDVELNPTQVTIKCHIGIQNGGFIRGNKLYLPNTPITKSIIREEMPFNRAPWLLRMKGDMLKLGIEEMLKDTPNPAGCFPHFSEKVEISYDPLRPKLSKIISFKIENEVVDDDKDYFVAISQNYVDRPCDNVNTFHLTDSPRVHVVHKLDNLIREIVVEYLQARNMAPIDGALPRRLLSVQQD